MLSPPRYLIMPAAGLGTRMKPVNSHVPKELLLLGLQPVIQYGVEEAVSVGIREIIIIISPQKESLRRYFEEADLRKKMFPLGAATIEKSLAGCTVTFLYQERLVGEADAIGLAADLVGNENVAIIYPDNVYIPGPGALRQMMPFFLETGDDVIALSEVTPLNAAGYSNAGRVDLKPRNGSCYEILRFIPKKAGIFTPRFNGELRACGICLTGPHFFKAINRARKAGYQGEFTDQPVREVLLAERRILGCRLAGTAYDVGNPTGYALCRREIQEKSD